MTRFDTIIVHDGTFHADDVICAALMKTINPNIKILRLSNEVLRGDYPERVIVADVGHGKYDHHQLDARRREDGKKYAACGLLLDEFKGVLFSKGVPEEFIDAVMKIEDYDNKYPNANEDFLSKFVRLCNPEWDDDQSSSYYDARFQYTADLIKTHFIMPYVLQNSLPELEIEYFNNRIIQLSEKHSLAEKRAGEIIRSALSKEDHGVVVLPKRMPWYSYLIPSRALFVVNPSNRGGYHLQSIPNGSDSNSFKRLLPSEWLNNKPEDCTFVHPHLFIAAFSSQELALKAIKEHIE